MKFSSKSLTAVRFVASSVLCLFSANITMAQATTIYTNQNLKVTGIAKGRFELAPSTRQFKVAEANPIDIHMHDTNVHAAHIALRYFDEKGNSAGLEGYSELVFKYHDDGTRYFNITPQRVGKMQIVVTVMFEDGRVEIEKIDDAVVAGSNS